MSGRIAYFNLIMQHQPGIANKLTRQAEIARSNGMPFDFYWLPSIQHASKHNTESGSALNIIPMKGRNAFSIRYHQARFLNDSLKRYDAAVLRYPNWDPVLSLFLRNRHRIVLEHHAKDAPELKLNGDKRWITEMLMGGGFIRSFAASTAVTGEILQYQLSRSRKKTGLVLPNGIDPNDSRISAPQKKVYDGQSPIHFLFVASSFSRWHGLEEVIDAWKGYSRSHIDTLHVVGRALPHQLDQASSVEGIVFHGLLQSQDLVELYQIANAGLTSFRLDLKDLVEASTLKVREYLLSGLPVFSGHTDSAFDPGFPWFNQLPGPDFDAMSNFLRAHADTSRESIRQAALPFIDAAVITQKLYNFVLDVAE